MLQKDYAVKVGTEGKKFCGLKFYCNYDACYADIKIPNYVSNSLYHFQHTTPLKTQYPPQYQNLIRYGLKIQYSKGLELSKHLNKKKMKHVQSFIGKFLYYARDIDSTMLPVLNDISSKQSYPTQKTMKKYN